MFHKHIRFIDASRMHTVDRICKRCCGSNGSDGGGIVLKFLACGARGPGFEPRSCYLDSEMCYLLLPSRDMNDSNSSKQPKPTSCFGSVRSCATRRAFDIVET